MQRDASRRRTSLGRMDASRRGTARCTAGQPPAWSLSRVADDRDIERAHAERAQRGHDRAFAGVVARVHRRAHVEQQRVRGGAHQHRQALPHVEHVHAEAPCAGKAREGQSKRQPQQQRERLARHAARQQQPERAEHRHRQREPARFGQPAKCESARAERVRTQATSTSNANAAARHDPSAPPRVQRIQPGPEQRERHHDQAPPRNRDEIRERPGERRLPEQRDRQRQQPDRRDRLRGRERPQQRPAVAAAGTTATTRRRRRSARTRRRATTRDRRAPSRRRRAPAIRTSTCAPSRAPRRGDDGDHQASCAQSATRNPRPRCTPPHRPPRRAPSRCCRGQRSARPRQRRATPATRQARRTPRPARRGSRRSRSDASGRSRAASPNPASSRPRVSPSASARMKRAVGVAIASSMRSAMRSRQARRPRARCEFARDATHRDRSRSPRVACASAWRSASKLPGFRKPRGARRRTSNSQRLPARGTAAARGASATAVPRQAQQATAQRFGLRGVIVDAEQESHAMRFDDGQLDDAAADAHVLSCESWPAIGRTSADGRMPPASAKPTTAIAARTTARAACGHRARARSTPLRPPPARQSRTSHPSREGRRQAQRTPPPPRSNAVEAAMGINVGGDARCIVVARRVGRCIARPGRNARRLRAESSVRPPCRPMRASPTALLRACTNASRTAPRARRQHASRRHRASRRRTWSRDTARAARVPRMSPHVTTAVEHGLPLRWALGALAILPPTCPPQIGLQLAPARAAATIPSIGASPPGAGSHRVRGDAKVRRHAPPHQSRPLRVPRRAPAKRAVEPIDRVRPDTPDARGRPALPMARNARRRGPAPVPSPRTPRNATIAPHVQTHPRRHRPALPPRQAPQWIHLLHFAGVDPRDRARRDRAHHHAGGDERVPARNPRSHAADGRARHRQRLRRAPRRLAARGEARHAATSASPAPRPTSKPRACCAARATSPPSCAASCRRRKRKVSVLGEKMVDGKLDSLQPGELQHRARSRTRAVAGRQRRRQRRADHRPASHADGRDAAVQALQGQRPVRSRLQRIRQGPGRRQPAATRNA